MKSVFLAVCVAFAAAAATAPTAAEPVETIVTGNVAYVDAVIDKILADTDLLKLITAQNKRHGEMGLRAVRKQDALWRRGDEDFINGVLDNPLSQMLKAHLETEPHAAFILVMDRYGANAGATHAVSDFYQGDEPQYKKTYREGVNAVHTGRVGLDPTTQRWIQTVSKTLSYRGQPIGAVTVAVDIAAR